MGNKYHPFNIFSETKKIVQNPKLDPKMEKTDSVQSQIAAEYKKENIRLQKQYVKMLVKKDSEIARLKAQLAEAKKKSHLIITRKIIDPNGEEITIPNKT